MKGQIEYEAERFINFERFRDFKLNNITLAFSRPHFFNKSLIERLNDFIIPDQKLFFLEAVKHHLEIEYSKIPLTKSRSLEEYEYRSDDLSFKTVIDNSYLSSIFYVDHLLLNYPKSIKKSERECSKDKKQITIFHAQEDTGLTREAIKHLKSLDNVIQVNLIPIMENGAILNLFSSVEDVIHKSRQIIFLASASLFASKFWIDKNIDFHLSFATNNGATIYSLILKPCDFENSPISEFQVINSTTKTMLHLGEIEREELWVHLVKQIRGVL